MAYTESNLYICYSNRIIRQIFTLDRTYVLIVVWYTEADEIKGDSHVCLYKRSATDLPSSM